MPIDPYPVDDDFTGPLRVALGHLSAQIGDADTDQEAFDHVGPVLTWVLPTESVAEGDPLNSERVSELLRFLVGRDGRVLAAVDLRTSPDHLPVAIHMGSLGERMVEAFDRAAAESPDRTFQARCLEVPGLRFIAVWLHDPRRPESDIGLPVVNGSPAEPLVRLDALLTRLVATARTALRDAVHQRLGTTRIIEAAEDTQRRAAGAPPALETLERRLRARSLISAWTQADHTEMRRQLAEAVGPSPSPAVETRVRLLDVELADVRGGRAVTLNPADFSQPGHMARATTLRTRWALWVGEPPGTDGLEDLITRCTTVGAYDEAIELLTTTGDVAAARLDTAAAERWYGRARAVAAEVADPRQALASLAAIGLRPETERTAALQALVARTGGMAGDGARALLRSAASWQSAGPNKLFAAATVRGGAPGFTTGWPAGPAGVALVPLPLRLGIEATATLAVDRLDGLLLELRLPLPVPSAPALDSALARWFGEPDASGVNEVLSHLKVEAEAALALDDLLETLRGADDPVVTDLQWLTSHLRLLHDASEPLHVVRDLALYDGRPAFKTGLWDALRRVVPTVVGPDEFEQAIEQMAHAAPAAHRGGQGRPTTRFDAIAAAAFAARSRRAGRLAWTADSLGWERYDISAAALCARLTATPDGAAGGDKPAGWSWARPVRQPRWATSPPSP